MISSGIAIELARNPRPHESNELDSSESSASEVQLKQAINIHQDAETGLAKYMQISMYSIVGINKRSCSCCSSKEMVS